MTAAQPFKIAAIQACPKFMDLAASVDKACQLIDEAGRNGAALAVFPEAFLPGYPVWSWFIPASQNQCMRQAYSVLHANSVTVPDAATAALCTAAGEAGVTVVMGINEVNAEASGSTIMNSLLYISADGAILGRHRKLVPTGGERLVWGMGDGSDLDVYDLPFAKVGGLICWENYMPLARHALYSQGMQIHVAPTWDRGEPWLSSMRHIAKESGCFVVGCCSPVHKNDIPDSMPFKCRYLGEVEGWINTGESVIVNPDGKVIAGPVAEEETILYADVDPAQFSGPGWKLDVTGHYSRPDVFEVKVNRRPRLQTEFTEPGAAD